MHNSNLLFFLIRQNRFFLGCLSSFLLWALSLFRLFVLLVFLNFLFLRSSDWHEFRLNHELNGLVQVFSGYLVGSEQVFVVRDVDVLVLTVEIPDAVGSFGRGLEGGFVVVVALDLLLEGFEAAGHFSQYLGL